MWGHRSTSALNGLALGMALDMAPSSRVALADATAAVEKGTFRKGFQAINAVLRRIRSRVTQGTHKYPTKLHSFGEFRK